ncbi:cysteine desulfurase [Corynebacterium sp. sy017]|uniref:cysteine desulfurase family protein n=1 Tax=unclassified Corynebacterium TaxID=2624378 RepID=UPI00118620AC|nr:MULTISPECIES: cysteine desulfurase family protein [unclassified Corynebacterium]MBP3089032.1 cysteine desulfurase [Corynebacterium sp. sy017]TSD91352.1 cysteine desulfurase [Corynebacterium sp. SY003]
MSHYFDHAATSPMREVAKQAWLEAASAVNPASQYTSGRKARSIVDNAREDIAAVLGCEPIEVIFTASGTEANNIGVIGQWLARTGGQGGRIITSAIEHPAVLTSAQYAQKFGAIHEELAVSPHGIVTHFDALDTPADVAACMWANNETGALQPVTEVIERAQQTNTPVHIDAVQVAGKIPINFQELGATTLAASGHKFGGPRSGGILLARRSPAPAAIIHGGGQERGIRSGTVDAATASALAAALIEATQEIDVQHRHLSALRTQLKEAITTQIDDVIFHTPENSLASHLYMSFPGAEGDSLIMLLDAQGIEASTGSACHNGVNRPSSVLLAAGIDPATARSTLRLTMGYTTTQADIHALIAVLPDIVARARRAGMA